MYDSEKLPLLKKRLSKIVALAYNERLRKKLDLVVCFTKSCVEASLALKGFINVSLFHEIYLLIFVNQCAERSRARKFLIKLRFI